jgi:hypothetical protein
LVEPHPWLLLLLWQWWWCIWCLVWCSVHATSRWRLIKSRGWLLLLLLLLLLCLLLLLLGL